MRVPGAAKVTDEGVLALEAHTDTTGDSRAGQGGGGGDKSCFVREIGGICNWIFL